MTPTPVDDRTPDEILAESLVDEALRAMAIPASLLPAIRVTLICELLTTEEGRQRLRRGATDPNVSISGDVAKPGAPAQKRASSAEGRGGAKPGPRRGGGRS